MGQYHKVANLDKCEIIHPHKLGCGLKLWEQTACTGPGVGAALVVLLASASNGSGGGDLQPAQIVGHWRGDRIAFVGDYDDDSSYATPRGKLSGAEIFNAEGWRDVSLEVADVIERELDGKYSGDGWRKFTAAEDLAPIAPDVVFAILRP